MGLLSRAAGKSDFKNTSSTGDISPEINTEVYEELEEIDSPELEAESEQEEATALEEPALEEKEPIKDAIANFHKTHKVFNCIVYDGSKDDFLNFNNKISEMVNTLGIVVPLAPAKPMVLFPKTMDSELLVHRLSKCLNASPVLSFEANSVESTINRIQSLIEDGSGKDQVITFQI